MGPLTDLLPFLSRYGYAVVFLGVALENAGLLIPGEVILFAAGFLASTVVGGGNTAVEEADYLTKFGQKVYLIHRRAEFRAQRILQERALSNPKIEVLRNTVVTAILGQDAVQAVRLQGAEGGGNRDLAIQGVFVFIGFTPNNIKKDHAKHDQAGFFLTNEKMETSVPGVYAVGDIRAQPVRQITNAVADGTVAAVVAEKYLEEQELLRRG
jgi:thioredoxin reductase (NADPH)